MITGHTIAVQLNGFFKRSDSPLINKVKVYFEWMLTRGYSSATVEGRSNDLVDFLKWCEERGFDRAVEINKKVIEGYRRHLFAQKKANGQHMALKTQCLKLIAIKGFFKWLSQQNEILYNPAADLDLPKVGQTLPHVILNVEEVERIMAEVDLSSPLGVRDRTMLEVFYATGIRRKELKNLKLYDIDLERQTLLVREGKGKKDRVVPLGARACSWLERYIEEERPKLSREPDEGDLFIGRDGQALDQKHISALVSDYIAKAGINKKGSCHLFRHTMATLMLEGGADIRFIQQMLGHSRLESTQIYTQVSIKALQEVHARTHPGVRKK